MDLNVDLNLNHVNLNWKLPEDDRKRTDMSRGWDRVKMAFRVRSSKFRHVFGSGAKKEHCYEGVRITRNAHDSNCCAVNPTFLAIITEAAGGGSFIVLPTSKVGRVDINAPKVCGHTGPVLDIKWNPFNDFMIASASDDTTVKIWQIPERGLDGNLTEWLVDLHGHQRRVGYIEWHPTAENILLSASFDFKCILWNTETAEPINIIEVHKETIFSISWNRDGSLFATTSKDKILRIVDPRQGEVVAEGVCHDGTKASKVVWVSEKHVFTTGFNRNSERVCAIWDMTDLSKPLRLENVDGSSGVITPYCDYDNKVVFLAGKGDGNIRFYEIVPEAPFFHYLNLYQSPSPQRGMCVMPKRGLEPKRCEIFRFYKLHNTKPLCEPLSMIVPRKSEMFQDDIYPPTASACPSLSANEWISGMNRDPILVSLKDGVLTQAPAITTYKAVKRSQGVAEISTMSNTKRPAPPTNIMSPPALSQDKLPASLRNIEKLSVSNDHVGREKEKTDSVSVFDTKRVISSTEPATRLTNANETMQVDRTVWSSGYTTAVSTETNGVSLRDHEKPSQETYASSMISPRLSAKNSSRLSSSSPASRDRQPSPNLSYSAFHTPETPSELTRKSPSPFRPVQQDTEVHRKLWNHEKDTTDLFTTPPASPYKPPSSARPGRGSLSPATSISWTSNPAYGQQGDSSRVDMGPLDDLLLEPSLVTTPPRYSPISNTVQDSRYLPQRSDHQPHMQRASFHGQDSQNRQAVSVREAVDNVTHDDNTELIDNISTHAPDDTLIKPSKLRSSIRSRKRGSLPGGKSDMANIPQRGSSFTDKWSPTRDFVCSDSDSMPNRDSNPASYLGQGRARESRSLTPVRSSQPPAPPTRSMQSSLALQPHVSKVNDNMISLSDSYHGDSNRSQDRRNHYQEPQQQSRFPTRIQATQLNNDVSKRSKSNPNNQNNNYRTSATLVFQNSPTMSPTSSSTNEPFQFTVPTDRTNSTSSYTFNVPSSYSNSHSGINGHSSERERGRRANPTRAHLTEGDQKVHVKKVWSPTSPPVVAPENGLPFSFSDTELRKAYFHQVEEIKSLHQEIAVKDKRIRQLEEELRAVRGRRATESNC